MLKLKITGKESRELELTANNMNELVDKIIDWQSWENQPLDFFERKGKLEKEKNSGWYFLKD